MVGRPMEVPAASTNSRGYGIVKTDTQEMTAKPRYSGSRDPVSIGPEDHP